MPTLFSFSGKKNLSVLFNTKIEGGKGRITFLPNLVMIIASYGHIGGV